jgi:hypothetical protein
MALRWLTLDNGEEADKMREIDELINLLCSAAVTNHERSSM